MSTHAPGRDVFVFIAYPAPTPALAPSCPDRYTHDVIALAAFGFDADSLRATEDRPSVSFQAMHTIVSAGMRLLMDPLSM